MNAEKMIEEYSFMDERERARFDKRYREFKAFGKRLKRLVRTIEETHPKEPAK